MAIEAFLEGPSSPGNRRAAVRRKLRLELSAEGADGTRTDGIIRNLSETGFLLQGDVALPLGALLSMRLPHAGAVQASVVWVGQDLLGCQFEAPITGAAVSAAQLRSLPDEPAPAAEGPANGEVQLDIPETFGHRLRRLRREREITLTGLARRVNVSKPTLWKWEGDAVRPRDASIAQLAAALGVSVHELLTGRGDGEAASSDPAEPRLSDALRECKERLARLAGTSPDDISITIRV